MVEFYVGISQYKISAAKANTFAKHMTEGLKLQKSNLSRLETSEKPSPVPNMLDRWRKSLSIEELSTSTYFCNFQKLLSKHYELNDEK